MEIDTSLRSVKDLLCDICTEPAAAILFSLMIQDDHEMRREGGQVVKNRFGCYGLMGKMSFNNDKIRDTRYETIK